MLIDDCKVQDSREFVSIFEYNSLKQQLKEAIQEKCIAVQKLNKVQNDISSISKLVKTRLFKKFGIPEEAFEEAWAINWRGSSLKESENKTALELDPEHIENKSEDNKEITEKVVTERYDNCFILHKLKCYI